MGLLSLSNELLDRIFTYCEGQSIKNLRLTSRRLHKVGNRHLIGELVLHYSQESLDFVNTLVTEHDDMTKGIESLWLQADRLPNYTTFESWNDERRKQYPENDFQGDWHDELRRLGIVPTERDAKPDGAVAHSTAADTYLARSYQKYQKLLHNQGRIDHSSLLREQLTALFLASPQLSTIWVTYGGDVDREETLSKSTTFREGLIIPFDNREPNTDQGLLAPIQLLVAAADAGRKLSTIVFGNVHYNFLLETINRPKIVSVLEHVERFRWDIGETFCSAWPQAGEVDENYVVGIDNMDREEHANMNGLFFQEKFLDFMKHFQNLRVLVLSLPEEGYRTQPVELADVVGDIHFPFLESFSIANVLMRSGDLTYFLNMHKTTLRRLRLCDLSMLQDEDDSWPSLFTEIAGKLPKLELVYLRGFFSYHPNLSSYVFGWTGSAHVGTPFTSRMEEYILGGEGDIPKQRDSEEAFGPMETVEKEKWLAETEILPFTRSGSEKTLNTTA